MAEEQKDKEVPEFVQIVIVIAAVVVGCSALTAVGVGAWSVTQWMEHTYPSPPSTSYKKLQGRVLVLEERLQGRFPLP